MRTPTACGSAGHHVAHAQGACISAPDIAEQCAAQYLAALPRFPRSLPRAAWVQHTLSQSRTSHGAGLEVSRTTA
eukprot:3262082-Rhodomonas_salina.1